MSQQDPNQVQIPTAGPQYPQQPVQGPPPGWQPPKKKTHKFRNFVVFPFVGLIALIVVISAASGGGGANTASTKADTKTSAPAVQPKASAKPANKAPATTEAPKATQAPKATEAPAEVKCTGNRNDPCTIQLGVAFTVGKHTMQKGWKLKTEEFLGTKMVGTLANSSDDTSTAFFTVKFLKGSAVVANFQCSSSELEPKQTEDVECINMSDVSKSLKPGAYNKITAEADF
jgi:hypothetical protein